ncbi:MAG: glycosyl hydrolase family 17 protein [Flavobacteriaceae bacterium]|jgi:glucan 1,3-beta-glucosidase|nr:glycosyl hydrolase family 17 protein [Flavobacteriaceae bacterium]MDG1940899.1 glycosyl hydrolase family 17 protein [Flavobacteriaceae bacterium]
MSIRREKVLSLAEINHENKSQDELSVLFKKVLKKGMHGLCFSPYEEGQKPGDIITEEQIRRRMKIIQPHTQWVRSFSCTEGNELIPKIAHELGLKTMVGAWLGNDDDINRKEIQNLIELAKEGYVDLAAVGNEVMYRGDLTEDELLGFMYQVKAEIPEIPVGYVDAYYEFVDRPRITEACDVIFANCYPYWEGCKLEYSLLYMKDMYRRAVSASKGKRVIVSEAGWPDRGQNFYGATPSYENAIRYFINSQKWSEEEDIEMFYFSSFDESWKIDAEGDVGAFWGLWDKNENLKY